VVLVGLSELAEISVLCAAECQVTLAAIVDAGLVKEQFIGLPVVKDFKDVPGGFEGAVITDLSDPAGSFSRACGVLGGGRVRAPAILGIAPPDREAAE
jgi:hypothetical protein